MEAKSAAVTSKNGTGAVTATYDEFTKSTSYSSDLYRNLTVTAGNTSETIVGLAATAKPVGTEYFIVANHAYEDNDSHLYRAARDSSGTQLQYSRVKTNVSSCSHSICLYSEIGTIKIDRGYLESKTKSGLRVRLEGQVDSQVIELPAEFVSTFLSGVPR